MPENYSGRGNLHVVASFRTCEVAEPALQRTDINQARTSSSTDVRALVYPCPKGPARLLRALSRALVPASSAPAAAPARPRRWARTATKTARHTGPAA